jgi:hypothetical protein
VQCCSFVNAVLNSLTLVVTANIAIKKSCPKRKNYKRVQLNQIILTGISSTSTDIIVRLWFCVLEFRSAILSTSAVICRQILVCNVGVITQMRGFITVEAVVVWD